MKRRVVIDGNIGSGKSTQLKLLGELGYTIHTEPIDDWPLDLFYADKSRWAFLLQMSILRSFCSGGEGIWERSPESSRNVFWKMLLDESTSTRFEDEIYRYFYDTCSWKPDVHVYIRTTPEECHRRIQSRHQEGDSVITLEYLQKLHEYYEDYVAHAEGTVVIIDGNKNPDEILRCIRGVLE